MMFCPIGVSLTRSLNGRGTSPYDDVANAHHFVSIE